jgi:hypothetical protein
MAAYTRQYSNFPQQVYTPHNFQDADNSIGTLINMIKGYMASGDYAQAQFYIQQNYAVLEPYVLNAEHINMIEEETRNCEVYALSRQQAVFYQEDEPDYTEFFDVWIA